MADWNSYLRKVCKQWNFKSPRPFVKFALDKITEHWNDKNIFIIEAPTGYGKSTISATLALYSACEELKAIVCYPLRTLIEDQYDTFIGRKRGKNAICDEKIIGVRYMHHPDSRYLIKPITLTTVDTLALTLFGIAPEDFEKALRAYEGISFSFGHYMFSWASAVLSNVILDEVHLLADSTKSLNFLIALLKIAIRFDQKLVLMSATLPKAFKKILIDSLQEYSDKIVFITFSKSSDFNSYNYFDEDFVKERMSKEYEIEIYPLRENEKYRKLKELIKEHCNELRKVLIVFNTVEDAINFYLVVRSDEEICGTFDDILLIHSRFTESDRREKSEKLKKFRNNYLIIATQVIEAGVDISSNLFITEIAPANSLVQRLGRFLRYNEERGKIVIWYEAEDKYLKLSISLDRKARNVKWICIDTKSDEIFERCVEILKRKFEHVNFKKLNEWKGKKDRLTIATPMYKVYDYELTRRTLKWLRNYKLNVHIPEGTAEVKGYKELLDNVYSEDDLCNIQAIEDLLRIHYHLESPENAVEILLRLEGSFVREEYQVNIVPIKHLNKFVGKNEKELSKLISKLCIPVSARMLRSLDITGFLYVDENDRVVFEKKKVFLSPKMLLRGIWIEDKKRLVSPIAFTAAVSYDSETGLRCEK